VAVIVFESQDGPIPFEVPDGGGSGGVAPASARRTVAGEILSEHRLEDALQVVGRAAASLQRAMDNFEFSKAQATIAVKISAEGSFVIAKTAAEATLSVTVTLDRAAKG
jgi:hypothetical protein